MADGKATLRRAYEEAKRLDVFFTGADVALSADNDTLACASGDECAVLSVSSGQKMVFSGDSEPITALCFLSPSLVALASRSLRVRVLSIPSGEAYWVLPRAHTLPIATLTASADGNLLASGGVDSILKVHDARHGKATHALKGHSGVILCARFHPDPSLAIAVTSADDGQVRAWSLRKNICIATMHSHFSAVPSICFSQDGNTFATAGRDKIVHVWESNTFKQVSAVPTNEAVEAVAILPHWSSLPGAHVNRRNVATVGERGRLRVFDTETLSCVYEQQDYEGASPRDGYTACQLYCTENSCDGILIATGDCRLLFTSASASSQEGVSTLKVNAEFVGNMDEVLDLAWVPPSNTQLLVATSTDTVRMFSAQNLACTGCLRGHTDAVLALDTAAPKRLSTTLAITASKDNSVKLWSIDECNELASGDGHIDAVSAVCIAKRESKVAVSGSADCTLRVWDIDAALRGNQRQESAAVRPLVAKQVLSAHEKDINCLSIAPNDSLVCSASGDKTAKVWYLPELQHKSTLSGHKRSVWSCVFSPVDKCIATGSADKTMRLWSLDGACLRLFEGHSASVLRIAFTTFGVQLVSAGGDALVKVWTTRTGECNTTMDKHSDKIWSVAVASNGDAVASGGSDASIRVWHDVTKQLEEEESARQEERIQKQQELENTILQRKYARAVELALELERPQSLLDVFKRLLRNEGEDNARSVLKGLERETLSRCIDFAREWNTNSKTCEVAHRMLRYVFQSYHPLSLRTLPRCYESMDAMLPYSQRCVLLGYDVVAMRGCMR